MKHFLIQMLNTNFLRGMMMAFLLFWSALVNAQEWKSLDTDVLFDMARKEAFDGSREKAREMLIYILEQKPDYEDVRILLGRTYAWDARREDAKAAFRQVLSKNPEYNDAINALVDVQMWGEEYDDALTTVNNGLRIYPNFEDFIYKKASILNNLARYDEAMNVVNQLLTINPASERGIALREEIKTARLRYSVALLGGVDVYSEVFDASSYSSLQLTRNNDWGSAIVRLNFANRFQTSGVQGEIDLYPTIAKGVYGYLNYGFSGSDLFPEHRFGAEVFSKLPRSFEGSLGIRYMIFDTDNTVLIYTGSIGKYYRSYWFSLVPFITPDKDAGTAFSLGLTARRYFGNPNNFIGINGRFGYSPDIRTIQGLPTETIFTLKSQSFGLGVQKQLKYNWLASANLNINNQQFVFDADNYILITSIYAQITYRFSGKKRSN